MEDDPVVREIDVCLCDTLMDKLALLQFPLRPAPAEKISEMEMLSARHKPRNRVLELVLPLGTDEEHFDHEAASHIRTKQQVLHGSAAPPSTTYAVGVFRDGVLHLTPLRETVQLRPSLAHVKDAPADGAYDTDSDASEAEAEVEREAKPATPALQEVTYKKKESDREIKQQRRSFAHHREQLESEAWVSLEVVAAGTHASDDAFHALYCEDDSIGGEDEIKRVAALGYLKQLQYMDTGAQVNPQQASRPEGLGVGLDVATRAAKRALGLETKSNDDDMDVEMQAHRVEELSYKTLATYADLDTQVFGVLSVAGIVTFDDVARIVGKTFPGGVDHRDLVEALKRFGLLVRGRWVLKSELVDWAGVLSPEGRRGVDLPTPENDDAPEAMLELLNCRELAVLAVHHYGFVDKAALMKTSGLDFRKADAVLRPWAQVKRGHRCFVLKLDEGASSGSSLAFGMQDFPDVVQDMLAFLAAMSETFHEELAELLRNTDPTFLEGSETDAMDGS